MRRGHRLVFVCFAACVLLLLGAGAGADAEEYRSEAGRFRVQMPAGWGRFAPFRMNQVKAGAGNKPGTVIHEGYELPNRFDGMPFILIMEVQNKMGPFESHDSVQRSLDRDFRKGFEQGAKGTASVGPIQVDRAKNRFSADTELRLPNGQRAKGVLFGFLGKEGVVMIQCLAMENEAAAFRPTFDGVADSFRFDEGFQFVPFDAAKVFWIVVGIGAGLVCLLAVVIAIIVTAVMVLTNSKPTKTRRRRR